MTEAARKSLPTISARQWEKRAASEPTDPTLVKRSRKDTAWAVTARVAKAVAALGVASRGKYHTCRCVIPGGCTPYFFV